MTTFHLSSFISKSNCNRFITVTGFELKVCHCLSGFFLNYNIKILQTEISTTLPFLVMIVIETINCVHVSLII